MAESSVLVYGTNLAGYRAAYALCKKGHQVIHLNRGSYIDEYKNQALQQLPLDFCWVCGHMPQRLFKGMGCLKDNYSVEVTEVTGEAGDFTIKFRKQDQLVNNFICCECDRCIEACPEEKDGRKAIYVLPHVAWENIYLIDEEMCTQCGRCEDACPTGALKLERPVEEMEVKAGAIALALEYESPTAEELAQFGLGKSSRVQTNAEIGRRSSLSNFTIDALRTRSGEVPDDFSIIVTPQFNEAIVEHENYNLSITAIYRALKIKELMPSAKVTVYLQHFKGSGENHYRFYEKAKSTGVKIEKVDKLSVFVESEEDVVIRYEQAGESLEHKTGMVILVTGQKRPSVMDEVTSKFKVESDERGFCRTQPFSVGETTIPGIFAAGEFTGVKGLPEIVWEGCAMMTEMLPYLGEKNFSPAPPPSLRDLSVERPNVGVFICSCFGTFSDKMDLGLLKEKVKGLKDVGHVEIIQGCCTPSTMTETAEKIKASGVNRVILAVCTPLQKLLKYRKTVMMAGVNPLLSEFLRLREDVINVHGDRKKMLDKALTLIRSGVEKVKRSHQEPTLMTEFTDRVLVIGGGVSGIMAAYEIGKAGYPVTIAEKKRDLGGMADRLSEDQRNYVNDKLEKLGKMENVEILTRSEVKKVTGQAGDFTVKIEGEEAKEIKAGAIMIAVGARESIPEGWLYGEDERVMTQSEVKEKLSRDAELKGRIAMIQCVGSKDADHPYCSRICCAQALENAVSLREKGAEVSIYYTDLNLYDEETELYKQATGRDVNFIRVKERPKVLRENERLYVDDGNKKEEYDYIVLSTGIEPDYEMNKALSEMLDYPLGKNGFFVNDVSGYPYEEVIKKLVKPFELGSNFIFPIGMAHSPRNFDQTLLIAKDAAGRAMVMLDKPKVPPPNAMYVAGVVESICMGCGVCIDVCPYYARYLDTSKNIAAVRPMLCDSCGTCVAICPNNASYLRDLRGDQVMASLDEVLI